MEDDELIGVLIASAGLITMLICKFIPGYMQGNLPIDVMVAILTFFAIFLIMLLVIAACEK